VRNRFAIPNAIFKKFRAASRRWEIELIRQRVLLAALTSWFGTAATIAISFLLTPFILHRLGDTQYGLLVLIGSVVTQGALLDLGIKPAVIKYVAQHHARAEYEYVNSLIATALSLYCLLGAVALILAVAIAPVFPDLFNIPPTEHATATKVMLLMGVQLAISIPCSTSGGVLWGLHRYGLANAISLIGTAASAVVTIAVLLSGGGIVAMVAAGIPLTLVIQAITIWSINRVAPELHFGFLGARRDLVRGVLSFSTLMFVMDIAYSLQTKIDEIVIGAFLPVSSVSPYSIARRLSGFPQKIAEQFLGAFLPLASQLEAEGDLNRLRLLYLAGSRITLAICLSLAGVLVVLAAPLLTLWVGERYAGYAPIVVILTLASVAEISSWSGGAILQGLGRHRSLAAASICAALGNLGLSLLLVRPYGLVGVAVATLIPTLALKFGYVVPCASAIIGVPIRKWLREALCPALGPAVLMLGVLYGVGWVMEPSGLVTVGSTAIVGLASYAIAYVIFSAGDPERQMLGNLAAQLSGAVTLRPTHS
jgi:O-antigen/teichoic acid export membrane protein